ncbi:MAG TPA: hypothetical protein PKA53_06480 [Sphingobacterium sp.]|nr:hypothetical protein [Sphingobacterium sp.]
MRHSFFLLFISFGLYVYPQQRKPAVPTTALQTEYGIFQDYAVVLDGKTIPQHQLVDYPAAKLYKIHSWDIKLEGHKYLGALYFHTAAQSAPPIPHTNDPAWFINGRQVSPLDIRSSKPHLYTRITKSTRDTVINSKLYRGSIHIDTDENFFADLISLQEIFDQYAHYLPAEQLIVHWSQYDHAPNINTTVPDNFQIYYLNKNDIKTIKVDRVQLADGRRYVLRAYKRMPNNLNKAHSIFENPLMVDTDCTCYLPNFNPDNHDMFTSVEIKATPIGEEESYLKKLSATMRLPAKKSKVSAASDSLTVRFIVTNSAMLGHLEIVGTSKPEHAGILQAIKRNSCVWFPGLQSGRPVFTWRKMTIFYSKDQDGHIQSLDRLINRAVN